jgi:hypothetical protein
VTTVKLKKSINPIGVDIVDTKKGLYEKTFG